MTFTANANGVVNGRFTIPANVQAGAKSVRVSDSTGTVRASATFTGRGTIRIEERRRVTTITETLMQLDPLAQTFTLQTGRHIAAVDLWFTVRGTSDVVVQIRNTQTGFPAQTVLAEARIKAADILLGAAATRVIFPSPVWLESAQEYAIVVLCDDATSELGLAELGKFDTTNQRWITSQPYNVGVMLSSSNAVTWTAHQDKDLAFRLLACRFTATTRSVDLGTATVANMSDMLSVLSLDIPATGAGAQIVATAPSGEVYRLRPDAPIAIPTRITGDMALALEMEGNTTVSPVLYPGIQFIAGNLTETGTYVGRAFPCGTASKLTVTLEAKTPGVSTVVVEAEKSDGTWQVVPFDSGTPVGDDWIERTYKLASFTATETRIRITLAGNAAARPRVRQLRAVATVA